MISKHVDIVAVVALLLGMLICSEARQSFWIYVVNRRPHLRVEQISVRVPDPPVVPIVFKQ
jgi:hypothetical protein